MWPFTRGRSPPSDYCFLEFIAKWPEKENVALTFLQHPEFTPASDQSCCSFIGSHQIRNIHKSDFYLRHVATKLPSHPLEIRQLSNELKELILIWNRPAPVGSRSQPSGIYCLSLTDRKLIHFCVAPVQTVNVAVSQCDFVIESTQAIISSEMCNHVGGTSFQSFQYSSTRLSTCTRLLVHYSISVNIIRAQRTSWRSGWNQEGDFSLRSSLSKETEQSVKNLFWPSARRTTSLCG